MAQLMVAMLPKSNVVNYELARNCGGLIYMMQSIPKTMYIFHMTLQDHVYSFVVALDTLPMYYELLVLESIDVLLLSIKSAFKRKFTLYYMK